MRLLPGLVSAEEENEVGIWDLSNTFIDLRGCREDGVGAGGGAETGGTAAVGMIVNAFGCGTAGGAILATSFSVGFINSTFLAVFFLVSASAASLSAASFSSACSAGNGRWRATALHVL